MRLYENYFADIDALNDEKIAELRNYHEETKSLIKYYYLDIPVDICTTLKELDDEYSDKLLGPEWHEFLSDCYKDFKKDNKGRNKSEEYYKAEFAKEILTNFYTSMDTVFRNDFGTGSDTAKGLLGLFFGKNEES